MNSRFRRRGALSAGSVAVIILFAGLVIFAVMRFQRAGGLHGQSVQSPAQLPVAFASSKPLELALPESKSTGKPMLLFFTADWCPPCKSLKKHALSDTAVAEAINARTIPVYVDCTKDVPPIGSDLNIQAFPTLILVRDGKEIARIVGAAEGSEITAWLAKHAG